MTIGLVLHNGYELTCEICKNVNKLFTIALIAMVSLCETAGRARAANELTRMGYYEEAKALMLGKEIFQEEKIDD
tara:strand:+ start:37096 stop:37320 length:225 start_codon:yes stop_codon:yes gene_type:complete